MHNYAALLNAKYEKQQELYHPTITGTADISLKNIHLFQKADYDKFLKEKEEKKAIDVFDNSALNVFFECPRKFFYEYELSLRPKQESIPLTVGTFVHEFLTGVWSGKDFRESIHIAVNSLERKEAAIIEKKYDPARSGVRGGQKYSIEWIISILRAYYHYYPLAAEKFELVTNEDGKPYLELGFALDMGIAMYTGKIDAVVRNKETGKLWIVDHKTTRNALGDRFVMGFNPNNQMSGYLWAVQEIFDEEVEGFIINGIRVGQLKTLKMSQLQDKMFLRILGNRSQRQLEMHVRQLQSAMKTIIRMRSEGPESYYQNAPNACTNWGGCSFLPLCIATDENIIKTVRESGYDENTWSPLPEGVTKKKEGSMDTALIDQLIG